MAKESLFNQRVTILAPYRIDDDMGGFSMKYKEYNSFWADVSFRDSKALDLPQYKESLQLIVVLRNTPDTTSISPDFIVQFRNNKYRIGGRKSDVKTVTLVCYEANT